MGNVLSTRWGLLLVTLLYGAVIHISHDWYLSRKWAYFGFSFDPFGTVDTIAAVLLLSIGGLVIPRFVRKPSSVILWQMFIIVYVPIIVITIGLASDALTRYGPILMALAVGFAAACLIPGWRVPVSQMSSRLPSSRFGLVALGIWAVSSIALLFIYRDIIAFSALDDIYFQRALTTGEAGTGVAYLRTYYSGVMSPLLLVIGLVQRRNWFVAASFAGFILTYAIDAQKMTLATPVAIIALNYLWNFRPTWTSCGFLSLVVAIPMIPLTLMYVNAISLPGGETVLDIVVFRMIGLPALTFTQYFDLFGELGYTFWSNTRGISLVVPPPDAFANDPSWPNLGYIAGDRYYGSRVVNANANPFSGEGVAAAGATGVLVISAILGAWLRVVDTAARGWDPRFASLVMIPVGLTLTNGHLATVLLTFGGLFWPVVFLLFRPSRGPRSTNLSPRTLRGRAVRAANASQGSK